MNRSALVAAVTTLMLVINYFGLLWQTSGVVYAFGMFIILGAAIVWLIQLVRHRG